MIRTAFWGVSKFKGQKIRLGRFMSLFDWPLGGPCGARGRGIAVAVGALACASVIGAPALADSLPSSLALAYRNNPSLNAQRASVRATDENVPQALAGYRPKVTITAIGLSI